MYFLNARLVESQIYKYCNRACSHWQTEHWRTTGAKQGHSISQQTTGDEGNTHTNRMKQILAGPVQPANTLGHFIREKKPILNKNSQTFSHRSWLSSPSNLCELVVPAEWQLFHVCLGELQVRFCSTKSINDRHKFLLQAPHVSLPEAAANQNKSINLWMG